MLGAREKGLKERLESMEIRISKMKSGIEKILFLESGMLENDEVRNKCFEELKVIKNEIEDILKEQESFWIS